MRREESYEEYDYYLRDRVRRMRKDEANAPSSISQIEYDCLINTDYPIAFVEMWNNRIVKKIKRLQAKNELHFKDVLYYYDWSQVEQSIINNKGYFECKIHYYENYQCVEDNEKKYFEELGLVEGNRYIFTAEYANVETILVRIGYDKYAYKKFITFNNIRLDDGESVWKKFTFACGKCFDNILPNISKGDLIQFSATYNRLIVEKTIDEENNYDYDDYKAKGGLSRPTKICLLEKKETKSRRLPVE